MHAYSLPVCATGLDSLLDLTLYAHYTLCLNVKGYFDDMHGRGCLPA